MIHAPLTIDEQVSAMSEKWPYFQLISRAPNFACWEGQLRPLFQRFTVRIRYRLPSPIEDMNIQQAQPRVKIIDPLLRPRPGDPEGQLPHVYYIGDGPLDVVLCMFDPQSDEWSPTMSLAETTVPWTADWIASYEGWRATGKWTGGGRHIDADAHKEMQR